MTGKKFVPRASQRAIINKIMERKRAFIFATPGVGKTASMLYSLKTLQKIDGDVFPCLVVAPLRVANTVWANECEEWEQFNDLTVSKIIGTPKQREDALAKPSHIYTINFEGLTWLMDLMGDDWKFKTVVVDESTRIKSHRCSLRQTAVGYSIKAAGKIRAKSLIKYCAKPNRFYCMTGTPVPNGLIDIWAQIFPLDFGHRLGHTFSEFAKRWFRPKFGSRPEQQQLEELPQAEKEITDAIRDISVVVNAKDYFDLSKPIEVDMLVELPPKARKIYDEVHRQSYAQLQELEGKSITAVNVGAVIMKCRQIASGHIIQDDGQTEHLHDEKIKAVKELVEDLNGTPLLIAYKFKADLEALKKAFPKLVVFPKGDKQKEVEAAWNAGKVPMMAISPQSAGHGLSFQKGSNHLCLYTMDWDSELYAQVIERIGPMRQYQSNLDRDVYIHRIIAKDTWEQIVAKRLTGKFKLSDAFEIALKMMEK